MKNKLQKNKLPKNGLSKKYFLIFICLTALSAIIFSSLFLLLATKYFKEDKYKLLYNNAIIAKNIIIDDYYSHLATHLNTNYITSAYNVISSAINSDIFLTDSLGQVKICQTHKPYQKKAVVPQNIVNKILTQKTIKFHGNLSGFYNDTHYVIAIPVCLNNNYDCIVFVATSSTNVKHILANMIRFFAISFVILIIISGIIISIVTRKMIDPLREIALITKIFSKGDFRKKIDAKTTRRDDEIGHLSVSLNEMAKSLEKTEENRRYFIASLSHELKTPMTIIAGSIEGILDKVIPSEKHEEYLHIISSEIKRLSNVVTSMTNLTKIDSGQMSLTKQKINISEFTRQIIFNFESQISNKNLQIFGLDNSDFFVFGDKDMIYQVIYNLIENAVKFTDNNGYIQVKLQQTGSLIYFCIKNSNKNINKENSKYIFDKFYKIDQSRSQDKTGIGLGLYIVRQILRLHNSDIEVTIEPGQHVEFFFSLPKA